MWWLWRSWLARQIVALEAVGSSPTSHPTEKADPGCYAARFPLFLFSGLSPSGKARDFDSRMRGFESRQPNQLVADFGPRKPPGRKTGGFFIPSSLLASPRNPAARPSAGDPFCLSGLRSIQKARALPGLFSYRSVIPPFPHETLLRKLSRGPQPCGPFCVRGPKSSSTGSFRQESGRFSFFRNILRMGA